MIFVREREKERGAPSLLYRERRIVELLLQKGSRCGDEGSHDLCERGGKRANFHTGCSREKEL